MTFAATAACPGVVGTTMVHRDVDHVTSAYGETRLPDAEERLKPSLGRAD